MNNKIKQLTEAFLTLGKEGYRLEIDGVVARLYRISKRSKLGFKQEFAYKFRTQEAALKHCLEFYNKTVSNLNKAEERKLTLKKQRAEGAKNVQVGDLFCYSWGYEQTNVNFYQVIEKKTAATIKVRPISYKTLEDVSWASEYVTPCANDFIGDAFTVRLNGDSFTRSCGYACKIKEKKL